MAILFTVRDFRIYFGTIYISPVRANVSGIFNKNKSGLRVWSNILFIIGPHLLMRVGLVVNETMNFVRGAGVVIAWMRGCVGVWVRCCNSAVSLYICLLLRLPRYLVQHIQVLKYRLVCNAGLAFDFQFRYFDDLFNPHLE